MLSYSNVNAAKQTRGQNHVDALWPVPQIYTGGAMCGTTRRRATVEYKCDPGLTTDTIMEVTEAPSCDYFLRVHTPRVCTCVLDNKPLNVGGMALPPCTVTLAFDSG